MRKRTRTTPPLARATERALRAEQDEFDNPEPVEGPIEVRSEPKGPSLGDTPYPERDYIREEWLAWQDVVAALEGLGVSRARFNTDGGPFCDAVRYWAHMKARLDVWDESRMKWMMSTQNGKGN